MNMDLWHEDIAALGVAVVTMLGGVLVAHISTRRKVDASAAAVGEQVEVVRKLAEPTGNGFARQTTEALTQNARALERIEARLALVDERQTRTAAQQARTADTLVRYMDEHERRHREES